MELELIKKYQGNTVRIFLNNGYTYILEITDVGENSIEAINKKGDVMTFAPEIISAIIRVSGTSKKW